MTSRTKTELSTAVLRKIGVVDASETPATEDTTYVQGVYDDKLAEWTDKGVVYWANTNASTNEIPDVVFYSLVTLIANEVQPAYGVPVPEADKIQLEAILLAEIRRHRTGTERAVSANFTKRELATQVLRRLGVISQYEIATNLDAATVWTAYDAKYAQLDAKGMVWWDNTDSNTQELPQEIFRTLVRLVANEVAGDFPNTQAIPDVDRLRIEVELIKEIRENRPGTERDVRDYYTKRELATSVLRRIKVIKDYDLATSQDAAIVWQAYDAKLEQLHDLGLVYWPNTDSNTKEIPHVVFRDLVRIMCDEVAADFPSGQSSIEVDESGQKTSSGVIGMRNLRRHMMRDSTGLRTTAEYF